MHSKDDGDRVDGMLCRMTHQALLLLDEAGCVLQGSQAAWALIGVTEANARGRRLAEVLPRRDVESADDDDECLDAARRRVGEVSDRRLRCHRDDRRFWLDMRVEYLPPGGGSPGASRSPWRT